MQTVIIIQALLELDQHLEIREYHRPSLVEACGSEISLFLATHPDWSDPLNPQEPGCDNLEFHPNSLDIIGNCWTCAGVLKGDVPHI